MRSAMMRAATSVDPPGGNGTTRVIWRDGYVCACTQVTPASAANTIATTSLFMVLPPFSPDQSVTGRPCPAVGRNHVQRPHPLARDFAAFSINVLPSDQIAPGTRCASAITASKDFSIQSQSASVMTKGGSSLIV